MASELSENIEAEANHLSITMAQREELDRRIADDDDNPDDTIPWEQVAAEASARWSK